MSNVLESIKNAARDSSSVLLDETVYVYRSLGITHFAELDSGNRNFLSVPVAAIGCLVETNAWNVVTLSERSTTPLTWRRAVLELSNESWDEDTIFQFEAPLKDPTNLGPNSSERLEFQSVGGLVTGTNYGERLAATKSWLICKRGDEATLVNANVITRTMNIGMKKLAEKAVKEDCSLAICAIHFEDRNRHYFEEKRVECLIRLGHNEIHVKTSDGATSLVPSDKLSDLKSRLTGKPLTDGHSDWIEVPNILLRQMLKDDWLNA
jgi:hypothetical protein